MDLRISYRHLESTPSIEHRITEKATKLKRFFHGKINVDWICSVESDAHYSDVTVSGDHFKYHAKASGDSLYKTIDDAIHKLQRQLEKRNDKVKEKIHSK